MSGHLQKELKQKKPFATLEQEAHLNVVRTATVLSGRLAQTLRPFDLTTVQYNVLRILRGAGGDGLPCSEVGDRLVSRDPDVTRLLDRLEKLEFVTRGRSSSDRRVVTAKITGRGKELVDRLDDPVTEAHVAQLGHLKKKQLKKLINLLEAARGETDE